MFKENGRKEPAKKEELASLKGKHMICPKCGEHTILDNVQFANTSCGKCGANLVDVDMASASKATGK